MLQSSAPVSTFKTQEFKQCSTVPPPINIAIITEVIFSSSVFVIMGINGGLDFTKGFMKEQRLITRASIVYAPLRGKKV